MSKQFKQQSISLKGFFFLKALISEDLLIITHSDECPDFPNHYGALLTIRVQLHITQCFALLMHNMGNIEESQSERESI